ncbi:hypothetical protein [Catalinimonas alkaloidigena]|uniref:hypothetical protein n=1 Tax=Catalinimonas alkaloidigena TaxID=1075417 RepID=UPI002405FBB9|nr:hypothetical protein [Catalinimonas alkaloidigena]
MNCIDFNIPGVKKLLIASHKKINPLYLNNDFHTIEDIPESLSWLSFDVDSDEVNLSESLNRTPAGKTYTQNISLKYLHIAASKLKELQLLTKSRLLVMVQDYSNQCWIAGIDKGLKISAFESSTGNATGENRYDLTLEGTNRIRFQEVSLTYAAQYLSGNTLISNCEYSIAGIDQLWIGNYPADLRYALDISNNNVVTKIEGVDLLFNQFDVDPESTELSESLELGPEGILFQQNFTFNIINLSALRREQITNIIKLKNLLVVVKDENSHWWVAGLDRSIRLKKYGASTDNQAYELEFSGYSRHNMKEISENHITEILNNTYTVSSLYDDFSMSDFATNNIAIPTIADARISDFN